jgi:hypothetical protein
VKAAIFYSITSTQKGLQVCEVINIVLFLPYIAGSPDLNIAKHCKNKDLAIFMPQLM